MFNMHIRENMFNNNIKVWRGEMKVYYFEVLNLLFPKGIIENNFIDIILTLEKILNLEKLCFPLTL